MERVYVSEPQKVGPWKAPLGIEIGDRYRALGSLSKAERWYRKVLELTPLEPMTTIRLVSILRSTNRSSEAQLLCTTLSERIGVFEGC